MKFVGQLAGYSLKAFILTLAALSLSHGLSHIAFVFELVSHFKMLWVLLIVVCVLITRGLKWSKWAFFCVVVLGINLWDIGSWYLPYSTQQKADLANPRFKIFLFNQGLYNNQGERIARWIADQKPDLVMIQEINPQTRRALNGLSYYPYRLTNLRKDSRDMAVWSRYPFSGVAKDQVHPDTMTSIATAIEWPVHRLSLLAIHPSSANHPYTFEPRKAEMTAVSQYIQTHPSPYRLVLGDLNITMWSGIYRRLMEQTALHNSRQGFGILPSWPTHYSGWHGPSILRKILNPLPPLFKRLPIDHCLLGTKLYTRKMKVLNSPEWGSDHFPLWIELSL